MGKVRKKEERNHTSQKNDPPLKGFSKGGEERKKGGKVLEENFSQKGKTQRV